MRVLKWLGLAVAFAWILAGVLLSLGITIWTGGGR